MNLKHAIDWRLKSLLTFSLPVIKRRLHQPLDLLDTLSTTAVERYTVLSQHYPTCTWPQVCTRGEFLESLYLLDLLDRYLPRAEIRGRCLDIGSKKWSYLPGLAAYTQTPWDGVELDPHQRYYDLSTRRAHADYMRRAYPDSRYFGDTLLNLRGSYPLITWFLPFVSRDTFSASGLPDRYFQPEVLLQHAFTLLAPHGRMLVVNQGEDERDIQAELLGRLSMAAQPLGKMESVFSPYKQDRYGWLIEKQEHS